MGRLLFIITFHHPHETIYVTLDELRCLCLEGQQEAAGCINVTFMSPFLLRHVISTDLFELTVDHLNSIDGGSLGRIVFRTGYGQYETDGM